MDWLDSGAGEPAPGRPARHPNVIVARGLALLALAVALAPLAVRWMDEVALRTLAPAAVQMKPNAALAFVLAAAALWLQTGQARAGRVLATVLAVACAAIGGAALAGYVSGADLGIDDLLLEEHGWASGAMPGRMSPLTACALVLQAAAIVLAARRPGRWAVRACAMHVAVIGAVAVLAHAWTAAELASHAWLPAMPLNSALVVLLLAGGVLALDGRMLRALRQAWRSPEERALTLSFWALVLVLAAAVGWTYRSNLQFAQAVQSVDGSHRVRLQLAGLRSCVARSGLPGDGGKPAADCGVQLLQLQAEVAGDALQAETAGVLAARLVAGANARAEQLMQEMDEVEALRLHQRRRSLVSGRSAMLVSLLLTVVVASGVFGVLTRRMRKQVRHSHAVREEVQRHKALLQQVIDSSSDLIVFKDDAGRYLGCNESYAAMLGRSAENIVGCRVDDLFPPAQAQRIRWEDEEVLAASAELRCEMALPARDGSPALMDVMRSPLRSPGGAVTGVLAVARNVTEFKRVEEELRRARAAAEQATQAKSAFLASMSHEIRTPMTGVLGMADLLATEDLTTRQRRYVDVMRASGRHLLAVTNDILDYSRIEAGRLEVEQIDFSLPELLECMRSLLQPLALERDIELRFELPPAALPLLTGDPTRLQQVLLNLASNAIKFTPQGRVTVRLLAQPRGARAVLLRLEVQDTGLGIPREALEQLFTPFTQADASIARQYGGSGLGLAISKRLAEAMGGTLDAASTPGLGSVFTLELALPVASSQAGAGQTAAAVAAVAPLRILVAEDNGINRDILQAALAARGHQLQFACDGNEALDLVQRHPFDLVLMDVQMPGLDGVEATRRIRQLDSPVRGIPVIALTANVLASEQERFLRAGMNECLAKPIDWERLFAAIGRYGDASAPVPAAAPTGLPDEGGACAEIDEQRLTVLQDITQPEHLRQLLASAVNTALAAHRRMQTSDLLAVVAEAHNLRGSCGTLGLALIAQTAGRIENAARAGQRDTELLARLGVQVEATRRSLAGRALL